MKRIPLPQGKYALVDDEDYPELMKYKWHLRWHGPRCYVIRKIYVHGKEKVIRMHRQIMRAKPGQPIDHRNHNGFDNQKHNLRFCTSAENNYNQNPRTLIRVLLHRYKGVTLHNGKWRARIRFRKREIWLGYFSNPADAAKAYDKAAKKYFGKFAATNF